MNDSDGSAPKAHRVFETKLRVRYAETDQMGVVYHSNYIVWFEVGRVDVLRELGFSYREMESDGTALAVVDARCRYKVPARYDDVILLRTRLLNVRGALVHFGYEVIRNEDGVLLAEGETTHLVIDREMKRTSMPEKYLGPLLEAAGKAAESG